MSSTSISDLTNDLSFRAIGRTLAHNRLSLVLLAVAAVAGYGFLAFTPNVVGDDWEVLTIGRDFPLIPILLLVGRYVLAGVVMLVPVVDSPPTLSLMVGAAGLLGFGAVSAHLLGLGRDRPAFAAFVGVLMFCPLWAETMSFKVLRYVLPVGLALSAVLLRQYLVCWRLALAGRLRSREGAWHLAGAVLAVVATAGFYQTYIFFAGVLLAGAMLLWCFRQADRPIGPGLLAGTGTYLAITFIGLVAYTLSLVAFFSLTGASTFETAQYDLRSNVSSVTGLIANVPRTAEYVFQYLFRSQHLWPGWLKVPGWAATAAIVLALVDRARSTGRPAVVVWPMVLLIAAVLMPWSLGLLRSTAPFRYNSLLPVTAVTALLFGAGIHCTAGRRARIALTVVTALTIAAFIHQHNLGQSATYWLNRRDLAVAQRMLQRIETHEQFDRLDPQTVRVEVFGRLDFPGPQEAFHGPEAPDPMSDSILTMGVLTGQTGRLPRLFHVLGADRMYVCPLAATRAGQIPPDRRSATREVLSAMPAWPAQGAIRFVADPPNTIFIKLGPVDAGPPEGQP